MWQRQPGQGRYAHPERERRLLLADEPAALDDPREIVDRYIDGTRLRLRRVTGDGPPVHKLAQKVRTDPGDPTSVTLTNIYLDDEEYQRLLALPAAELRKTRFSVSAGRVQFAVDVFGDQLEGLVLAECDLDACPVDRTPPLEHLADVTSDDRFSGGQLARTDARTLTSLLAEFGVAVAGDDEIGAVVAWRRLREVKGRRTTVIDLYRMVAEPRGLEPHQLPKDERFRLARLVMPIAWPGFEVTANSERSDPITVVAYDADWPRRFEQWRDRIADALGGVAHRIDHVGSTSVVGLPAKSRIDVQVSVADMEDEDAYVPPLESIGVQLRSRDTMHRYFRPFADRARDIHVHVCNAGSAWEREHLLFRDYLRLHPDDAERYAEAKWEAVNKWADDGWGYTDAKTDAILDILEKAEAWAAAEGWAP